MHAHGLSRKNREGGHGGVAKGCHHLPQGRSALRDLFSAGRACRNDRSCVAREEHVAHIIIGTRGLGGVRGLLLGSVATQLHLAGVPVTLVN
jgi:hypothetical protein